MPNDKWSPTSWRARPIQQQPTYDDMAGVEAILSRIRSFPPLVFSAEIEALKHSIGQAAAGKAFVLHGGACAEQFIDCDRERVVRKLKILLQMSLVLTRALGRPVVRIGRMAGQFAKPRSSDMETVDGVTLPSYRGDIVNDLAFDEASRRPDPQRLLTSYHHSAAILNFVRALIDGGFADLHHPNNWQLGFMGDAPTRGRFQAIADSILEAIQFFEALGSFRPAALERVDFFTSHEGLLLAYEEAFTIVPPRRERHYNLGAHFLWIGDRTRQLDGAHVEFFRGIANPIGVKVGPTCDPDDLSKLIEALNPDNEPGRLTLITRYGRDWVEKYLPQHIRAAQRTGIDVMWSCDPMHGNGIKTSSGVKTRCFDAILDELKRVFEVHRSKDSRLGGVHFELTGQDVTECIGGAQGLSEKDLGRAYETGCDPRLNYSQSLEMAFLIADLMS